MSDKTATKETQGASYMKNETFTVEVKDIDLAKITEECVRKYAEKEIPKLTKQEIEPFIEKTSKDARKILHQMVIDEVQQLKPTHITIGSRKSVEIKGRTHKSFQECLFICEQERQLYISGPAGSGKTTVAEQIARAFKLNFRFISCSAGLSEGHLLGRMLFDGTYVQSDFVDMYENGGVFLFDEIDAADANTLLIINSALANGYLSIPNRKGKQVAQRSKDFICICAANTWGHGSFEYHGRNNLDAAFLDRFAVAKVIIDYDKDLEKELTAGQDEALLTVIWTARENIIKHRMRRVMSTRAIVSGYRQIKAGKELKEVLERIALDYTFEEKKKIFPCLTEVEQN